MSLGNLKPEVQRALAIAIPAVVLLFAAIVLVPKLVGIRTVSRKAEELREQAVARQRANETELGILNGQRMAARPQTKGEQLAFLRQLNGIMTASHIRLVSYRPPTVSSQNGTPDSTTGSASAIKPLPIEVTVSGNYPDLVTLFRSLALADRLLSVENLQMRVEGYPRLSATFRLVRYITPSNVASLPGGIQNG